MAAIKIHITWDEEMLHELDALAVAEHRSRSELLREAFRQYARPYLGGNRGKIKAAAHAAIDRAAGAWSAENHPETASLAAFRRWRDDLWAEDDRQLRDHAE